MSWLSNFIKYSLITLAALATALVIIWLFFAVRFESLSPALSVSQVREECDRQFAERGGASQLDAGTEYQYLLVFTHSPAFVMVRARPSTAYDYPSAAREDGQQNLPTVEETRWDEVTTTIVRYVNPLRNEAVCGESALTLREGGFEAYCDVPAKADSPDRQEIYVFLTNQSSVPIEYCIVSNCDASSRSGQGALCQVERQRLENDQ